MPDNDAVKPLPVLPLHGQVVVFPQQATPLYVGRPASLRAVDEAMRGERVLFLVAQRNQDLVEEDPPASALYRVGCIVRVLQAVPMPDGALRLVVEGLQRGRMSDCRSAGGFLRAKVTPLNLTGPSPGSQTAAGLEALVHTVKQAFEQACELEKSIPSEIAAQLLAVDDPERLLNLMAMHVNAPFEQRQELLEILDQREAMLRLRILFEHEIGILRIEREIDARVRKEVGDSQKEYILRERLKAVQAELGEVNAEAAGDVARLRAAVDAAGMSDEAHEKANKELARLEHVPPSSPESVVIRTYVETLCELPWQKRTEDSLDVVQATRVLDEDHHGLQDVKERIVEFLAVRKLTAVTKGPILCFVGPPGVGKTSIGKSIARSMGRKFVRISLGGIRDEAEIRGHRRTYIGSMPGRIMSTLRQIDVKNPVFMLDEVDKMGLDFRGDPAAALLEALDPEQNDQFSDHYLEVRFDLSEVMFLLTANVLDTIPPALLDRMEVIEFAGYIEDEKLAIARDYLLPKQLEAHGLTAEHVAVADAAILALIRDYTREAGVRNLERTLAGVCRKIARDVAAGRTKRRRVTAPQLDDLLGAPRFKDTDRDHTDAVGVATGLAYTPAGGSVLAIEVGLVPGTGELKLTGRLGEVMRESAQAAWTYVRARAEQLDLRADLKQFDVHIHVPEGATPKDGPSAGITMAVALASAASGRSVRGDVAMTGEITLRGRVLPIGGVREKILAAFRQGVRQVILPIENRRDLEKVPQRVRRQVAVHYVQHMDEVLPLALVANSASPPPAA